MVNSSATTTSSDPPFLRALWIERGDARSFNISEIIEAGEKIAGTPQELPLDTAWSGTIAGTPQELPQEHRLDEGADEGAVLPAPSSANDLRLHLTVAKPESLPFAKTLALLRKTNLMLGVAGAGMMNQMLLPRESLIVLCDRGAVYRGDIYKTRRQFLFRGEIVGEFCRITKGQKC